MLTNTIQALEEMKNLAIKISDTKNGECIHQTQRNGIGATLRAALVEDFTKIFPISDNPEAIVAYLTEDGLVLEIPNETVKDNITNADGSGAITVELGFTVKSLTYNAQDKSEAFKVEVAEKEAKEKAKAEAKARKIAADKKARAEKAKKQNGEG